MHTLHKSQRFSRKLKRRLTQRTFTEARALKKQSKEAIHILFYAAELVHHHKIHLKFYVYKTLFFFFFI